MQAKDPDDKYTIQSVENALDLLAALSEADEEVRIARLSERLKLGKAKVFRLMATLERRGYVERERTGVYRVGSGAFEMAQKLLSRFTLLGKAKPVMEALARNSDEAVYLGILRGQDVLLIEMIDTLEQIKVVSLLGQRYPAVSTAAGRALVEDDGRAFFTDLGGLGDGIACLSAPVRNARGRVCCSLSLVGPDFRFSDERTARLLTLLVESADLISSRSGFLGQYATLS